MSYSEVVTVGNAGAYTGGRLPAPVVQTWFPNHASLGAAMSAVPGGALILLMPGDLIIPTGEDIFFDQPITVAGIDADANATVVRPTDTDRFRYELKNNGHVVLDNFILRTATGIINDRIRIQSAVTDASLFANRVHFHNVSNSAPDTAILDFGSRTVGRFDSPNVFRFQHCSLTSPTWRFIWAWRQSVALNNVFLSINQEDLDKNSLGALFADDTATVATEDYGHSYGTPLDLSALTVELSSRVIDTHAAPAKRVVVFDWSDPQRHVVADIDSDGYWTAAAPPGVQFGVYYLSREHRSRPIAHGPYTAPNN